MKRTASLLVVNLPLFCMDVCKEEVQTGTFVHGRSNRVPRTNIRISACHRFTLAKKVSFDAAPATDKEKLSWSSASAKYLHMRHESGGNGVFATISRLAAFPFTRKFRSGFGPMWSTLVSKLRSRTSQCATSMSRAMLRRKNLRMSCSVSSQAPGISASPLRDRE